MSKRKFKTNDVVILNNNVPLYIQEEYTPNSKGVIVGYDNGKYEVKMSMETLHLPSKCLEIPK